MTGSQLNIFSWQKEKLAEGYQSLAVFRFDAAERAFREIMQNYTAVDQEVDDALHSTTHWKKVFEHYEAMSGNERIPFLHHEIIHFNFLNTWGMQRLRSALISRLVAMMREANTFYVNTQVCLADLLLELGKNNEAEEALIDQLTCEPDPGALGRFRLAQIQWLNGNLTEAKKNYSLALLLAPANVPLNRIESGELKDLIETHGPGMAPAYGWVSGALPLVRIPTAAGESAVSETHCKALTCYRLLRKAEEAAKNNDLDACVEYRKQLKETDPDLYDRYFALLSKRRLSTPSRRLPG